MNPRKLFISACLVGLAGLAATPAHAGWKWKGQKADQKAMKKVDAVFLHGLGGAPSHFPLNNLKKELATQGMDLQLDAPWLRPVEIGFDGKAHGTGPHTMSDQLDRARKAINMHEGPVVLFGHSFGGKAAIALAKEFPGKVKGIVAFAPSVNMMYSYYKNLTGERGLPDEQKLIATLEHHQANLRNALDRPHIDDKERKHLYGELHYLTTMMDLAKHNETKMELDVGVPTLMLHGTDDTAVSIHYAKRFAGANPKVNLVEYPGIGHGMDNEKDRDLEKNAQRDMATRIHNFLLHLDAK